MGTFEKETYFSIFRYQLLPISNDIQLSFVDEHPFSSINELKERMSFLLHHCMILRDLYIRALRLFINLCYSKINLYLFYLGIRDL